MAEHGMKENGLAPMLKLGAIAAVEIADCVAQAAIAAELRVVDPPFGWGRLRHHAMGFAGLVEARHRHQVHAAPDELADAADRLSRNGKDAEFSQHNGFALVANSRF